MFGPVRGGYGTGVALVGSVHVWAPWANADAGHAPSPAATPAVAPMLMKSRLFVVKVHPSEKLRLPPADNSKISIHALPSRSSSSFSLPVDCLNLEQARTRGRRAARTGTRARRW